MFHSCVVPGVVFACLMCLPVACGPSSETQDSDASAANVKPTFERVGGLKDLSYGVNGTIKRVGAKVVIPPGLREAQVRGLLAQVAIDVAKETDALATVVDGYRSKAEIERGYTVGKAVYAPFGDWGKADSGGPMDTSVVLGTLYFQQEPEYFEENSEVVLHAKRRSKVKVSLTADRWGEEDAVAELSSGTRATVVGRKVTPIGSDMELVRYLIRAERDGKTVSGWVHDSDLRR